MPSPVPKRRARAVACVLASAAAVTTPLVASEPASAAPATSCATGASYTVVAGDSWFALANQAGITVAALLEANGAGESTVIRPGDHVCLPAGTTAPASWATRACAGGQAYTVETGDSWFGIAARAGVASGAVLTANAADAARALHPGDVVCLPAGASIDASPASASASSASSAVTLDALPMHGPCWFGDTWQAPRGGGRRHQGTDLIAESGQYVYAVTDGTLTRRAWAQPGLRAGNAWWLTSDDGSGTYFFYAHLSDFTPGLRVGSRVEAGEIIGFVGSTGSSSTAHLHFEVHPGGAGPVNPYPVLKSLGGCKTGTGYAQPGGWTPSADEAGG